VSPERGASPRTGYIDHLGIGVPDLAAAKRYDDQLMPVVCHHPDEG